MLFENLVELRPAGLVSATRGRDEQERQGLKVPKSKRD